MSGLKTGAGGLSGAAPLPEKRLTRRETSVIVAGKSSGAARSFQKIPAGKPAEERHVKMFCLSGVSGAALCLGVFYACDSPLSATAAKESASPERFLVKPITVKDRMSGREYKTSGGWGSGQIDGKYRIVSLTTSGAKKDFEKIVELLSDSHGKEAISPVGKETRYGLGVYIEKSNVPYEVEYVSINGERAVERWDGPWEDAVRVSKKFVYCKGWFSEL
jgi:hypothetical protein